MLTGTQIEQERLTTELNSDDGSDPLPMSHIAILWCLRIVIGAQCLGLAGRYLFSTNESESDIFGYLFFDNGWSENLSQLIDDVGAYGCLASAFVLIIAGIFGRIGIPHQNWSGKVACYLEYAALVFVVAWFFLLAAAQMARGEAFAEFAIAEQAVRFATPLAMILFLRYAISDSNRLARAATFILTFAVFATFAAHGYIAQELHGPFIDLILLTDMRLFKSGLEQSTAETLLKIIGWTDIALGALLLMTRWRVIAIYMMIWGLITAASRMTAFGIVAWPETLIRAANAGGPLALILLYGHFKTNAKRAQSHVARDRTQ